MCPKYFSGRVHRSLGFTLIELLVIISIFSLLLAVIIPSYQRHLNNARLHDAQSALMLNAQFLERYYAQNARFTKNSTTWPQLPIRETDYFQIAFTGTARGAKAGTYRLQATAKNTHPEPRYLVIDQNHILQICKKEGSRTLCKNR